MSRERRGRCRMMMSRKAALIVTAAPLLAGCGAFGGGAAPPPVAPVAAAPPAGTATVAPPAAVSVTPLPPPVPTGAALGGVLGGPVGAGLNDADRASAWNAQIAALESGQRRSWRGAHGVFGFVEPGADAGAGCRAYSQTIYVSGRPNKGHGVACKQADGAWTMSS